MIDSAVGLQEKDEQGEGEEQESEEILGDSKYELEAGLCAEADGEHLEELGPFAKAGLERAGQEVQVQKI